MHNFKELTVWQEAIKLTKNIYSITSSYPKEEKYGIISQIRRASVSIPSNIAEGSGRDSKKEFNQFLNISLGSCFELETQLIISEKLDFIANDDFLQMNQMLVNIQKMLNGLKKSLIKTNLNT